MEGTGRLKLKTEILRADLAEYLKVAAKLGLPGGDWNPQEAESADEAALVDLAATLGWDLGKYVEPA